MNVTRYNEIHVSLFALSLHYLCIRNITIYYTNLPYYRTPPVFEWSNLFLALALVHTSHMGTKRSTNSPSTPTMHSVSEDKDAMYTVNHTKSYTT